MLRTTDPTDRLTAEQIAVFYSVTPSTVRRWASKTSDHDACPHEKDARGRLRFDLDLVADWLDDTGVIRRSRAQTKATPPVHITEAIRWKPEDIAGDIEDADLHAVHRTIVTALFTCRHADELPTPSDFNLDTEEGRDAAIAFIMDLEQRPAEQWKRMAYDAIEEHHDEYMGAIYGA